MLGRAELPAAAATLGRAFFSDPGSLHLFPDEARRERLLPWFLERALRFGCLAGEVHADAGALGVAIWLPPARMRPHPWWMLRSGLVALPLRLSGAERRRMHATALASFRLRARVAPQRHWHLSGLGVEPHSQRLGIASSLVRPMLARAAASGHACYLETANPDNVPVYEHLGFVLAGEGRPDDGGPALQAMLTPVGSRARYREGR